MTYLLQSLKLIVQKASRLSSRFSARFRTLQKQSMMYFQKGKLILLRSSRKISLAFLNFILMVWLNFNNCDYALQKELFSGKSRRTTPLSILFYQMLSGKDWCITELNLAKIMIMLFLKNLILKFHLILYP
jgi:hypothetical protein